MTSAAHISIITSLYRAEAHLPTYNRRVIEVAAQVKAAGLALEIVLVANDPAAGEQTLLARLAAALESAGTATTIRLDVPRENLYASWNRGIVASSGRYLAIWNADDDRYAGALIEGQRLIAGGCEIVDFPFALERNFRWLFIERHRRRLYPPQYDPVHFGRRTRTSPFFMFARLLYDRVGPFDEHFRIGGDFDWCARPAARSANFCAGTELAGTFFLHGANLSGSNDPAEAVEDDIVLLRQRLWDELVPADPARLSASWSAWGDLGDLPIPPEIQDRLWGAGAFERWQAWQRQERRKAIGRQLRYFPRQIIDRTGLRPWLARLGVVKRQA